MNFRTAMTRALLLGSAVLFAAACGEDQQQIPTETESPIEQVQSPAGDVGTALAVQNRHTPDLMEIEGVVGTGLAMKGDRPVIRVYTVHGNVRGIPDHVENVPIERVVTGLIMAGTTTRERPAPNGFSIGHPDITAGTFGALVRNTNDDVCHALSNNHVLANSNDANIGDSALQPGPFDGGSDPADAIGTLSDFEPISFSSDNVMDAAIAEFFDAADAVGATPSSAYGEPGSTPTSASVNMAVQKFGRTTGHTQGTVAEINATISVCYETRGPFMCAAAATFVNQFTIEPGSFSDGGDSGSLIVTDNSNANPVGLLFAGSDTRTIANPIDPVLNRFSAVIETDPTACANGGDGEPPANEPPTADFTFTTTDLTADFTDTSSDSDGSIASWSWDFGDDTGSTAQNPSHTYSAGGTYSVTLTVEDDDGATDSFSDDVTVTEASTGDFTLSATGFKERGLHKADLTWDGATTTNVDIKRNGVVIATVANSGAHRDHIDQRGSATYTYEVCEPDTTTCSNEDTVVF